MLTQNSEIPFPIRLERLRWTSSGLRFRRCWRMILSSSPMPTIDRLLRPIREQATGRTNVRPKKKTRSAITVKTFSEWEDVAPGSLEADFVAHCGGNLSNNCELCSVALVSGDKSWLSRWCWELLQTKCLAHQKLTSRCYWPESGQ